MTVKLDLLYLARALDTKSQVGQKAQRAVLLKIDPQCMAPTESMQAYRTELDKLNNFQTRKVIEDVFKSEKTQKVFNTLTESKNPLEMFQGVRRFLRNESKNNPELKNLLMKMKNITNKHSDAMDEIDSYSRALMNKTFDRNLDTVEGIDSVREMAGPLSNVLNRKSWSEHMNEFFDYVTGQNKV